MRGALLALLMVGTAWADPDVEEIRPLELNVLEPATVTAEEADLFIAKQCLFFFSAGVPAVPLTCEPQVEAPQALERRVAPVVLDRRDPREREAIATE